MSVTISQTADFAGVFPGTRTSKFSNSNKIILKKFINKPAFMFIDLVGRVFVVVNPPDFLSSTLSFNHAQHNRGL